MLKVRFAPSPTGPLHIGGARSALFNYLLAKSQGGKLVLRIEDTDRERSSRQAEENIKASLRWLGINWDEGIDVGGPNGPYRQTERLEIYNKYLNELLETGWAYPCYCSAAELEQERQAQVQRGETPRYSGRCRNLSDAERRSFEARGITPTIRFRVPEGRTITIRDLVRGTVKFETDGLGDYIIAKSDGLPTYNFAVVVDDATMGITHVIRAEEHLSNTPRQVLIYEALGLKEPQFGHISLILGEDHTKMSKRHGATSIEQYREQGYLPEALVNFLALLGWSPAQENEILTMEELIGQFSLERVSKSPAVFDLAKLNWLNAHYLREAEPARLFELARPFFEEAGYLKKDPAAEEKEQLLKITALLQGRIEKLADLPAAAALFFNDRPLPEDDTAREALQDPDLPRVLPAFKAKIKITSAEPAALKKMLKDLTKELGLGGKKVYMPLRVLLTGQTHGPELPEIMAILGTERVLTRIEFNEKQIQTVR